MSADPMMLQFTQAPPMQSNEKVWGLLPENGEDEIEDMHFFLVAQQEAQVVNDGSEVQVLDDAQLNCPVIELLGPRGALTFACNVPHRYLGIHMRHLHKFLTIEVDVVDSSQKYRKFHLSTRRSIATVTDEVCEMPMMMQSDDWQLVMLDLQDMCARAYGTDYESMAQVKINATCRVAKVYMADALYSDAEMPAHLRAVKPEKIAGKMEYNLDGATGRNF
mmetsp:Transcript_80753/g.229530  ORF Transcript_80753/g.229530 Transcript_80753/m.229530 type:complete len:220 (+) Transcript_80753:149-808(+)|eukprot:CAMPEP_0119531328 /NCGR_PEP_ID=MMETSP1344-20130328/45036_1 /TAXON_ID=236787 /ORGANISM="Florenciella parvula, Strain CCMP2471" /LENGTH=219 /DNA_ID=CAMNT_0007571547 /DNA_START=148 /DNA_END=807 /DNA_ORIENTATION=+